jgi:hypothetical protein
MLHGEQNTSLYGTMKITWLKYHLDTTRRLLIESSHAGGKISPLNWIWVSKQDLTSSTDRIKQLSDDKKELYSTASFCAIELFILLTADR